MPSGRKKTPTAVLKAKGSHRAKKRTNEPQPKPGQPERPAWLRGKAEIVLWKKVCATLEQMGLLTEADGTAIALLVDSLTLFLEARDQVKKEGVTLMTPNGCPIINPALGARNRAWAQVKTIASEFGMTPSARASLAIEQPNKKKDDGKERFFKPRLATG